MSAVNNDARREEVLVLWWGAGGQQLLWKQFRDQFTVKIFIWWEKEVYIADISVVKQCVLEKKRPFLTPLYSPL